MENPWMLAIATEGGLMTPIEAARSLGITRQSVCQAIDLGTMPVWWLSGKRYIGTRTVEAWRNRPKDKLGRGKGRLDISQLANGLLRVVKTDTLTTGTPPGAAKRKVK